MKKLFRALIVLLSILLLAVALTACSDPTNTPNESDGETESITEQGDTDPVETAPSKYAFVSGGATEYSIVTPSLASNEVTGAAESLQKTFKEKASADIAVKTDRYNTSNPNYTFPKFEILIGDTNRPESTQCAEGLAYDDYSISILNGKLVIVGGSDSATVAAVEKFKDYITSDTLELSEGNLEHYDHAYTVKTLTVGENDISKFTIKMQSKTKCESAAENIIKTVRALCGVTLTAEVGDSAGKDACEIIIGKVNASGIEKMPSLAVDEYAVYLSGNKIFIDGGSNMAVQKLGNKIYDCYTNAGLSGDAKLELSTSPQMGTVEIAKYALADGATFRIMSNNMCITDIADRAELIVAKYLEYLPDVIGLQECNASGQSLVVKGLSDFYNTAVLVQDDSDVNPYTPILYRKDKYTVVDSGSYFFDSRYKDTNTKSLTWVVLEDIKTGKRIGVINAHYSLVAGSYLVSNGGSLPDGYSDAVEGVQWRNDNSRQMIERAQLIKEKYGADTPVFLMGDLNSDKNQVAIQMLDEVFDDTMNIATVSSSNSVGSCHYFFGVAAPEGALPIDHIFTDPSVVTVYTHEILTDKSALDISDHSPVVVDLSFK